MPSLSIPSLVGMLTIDEEDDAIVAISWGNAAAAGNGSPLLNEAARQLAA